MLIAILALYFIHHQTTGVYTFEYSELLGTQLNPGTELWIMLGFFVAFAVKLPVVPLHTWLPDAHTEAPTAGSVILAGLLLKTGAYGLMRFVIPLFPHAAHEFTPIALALAVIGIVYGAVMAFSQTDLKRLVAYTSVSHLGFVLLGIFSWNPLGASGRDYDDDLSRAKHRRAFHSGRRFTGTHPHSRSGAHGWTLGRGATLERSCALLQSGLARACRDWAISSESFSSCWALTRSVSQSRWSPVSVFSRPPFMPCAWCSAPSRAQTRTLGNSPT